MRVYVYGLPLRPVYLLALQIASDKDQAPELDTPGQLNHPTPGHAEPGVGVPGVLASHWGGYQHTLGSRLTSPWQQAWGSLRVKGPTEGNKILCPG